MNTPSQMRTRSVLDKDVPMTNPEAIPRDDGGVFVSSVSTAEWEPDPDVGGLMHVLCSVGRIEAGLSRFEEVDGPVAWTLPARETLLVLEGHARIDIEGRHSIDLGPGDMASLPKGSVTTWHLTAPFREFWVLASE